MTEHTHINGNNQFGRRTQLFFLYKSSILHRDGMKFLIIYSTHVEIMISIIYCT